MYPSTPHHCKNTNPAPNRPNLIEQSTMKLRWRLSPSVAAVPSCRAISPYALPSKIGSGAFEGSVAMALSKASASSLRPEASRSRKPINSVCCSSLSASLGFDALSWSICSAMALDRSASGSPNIRRPFRKSFRECASRADCRRTSARDVKIHRGSRTYGRAPLQSYPSGDVHCLIACRPRCTGESRSAR